MPWFRVRVAGKPLPSIVDGEVGHLGFFVNRVVHAATLEGAQVEAFEVVAAEARRRALPDSPAPRLAVDAIDEMSWWAALFAPRTGFVLFPLPHDEGQIDEGEEPISSWLTYDAARSQLAAHLQRDASLQESGEAEAIGRGYKELDGRLRRGQGAEWNKVFVALSLWDYWIDARNHQWEVFYEIAEEEWPWLAREVAADLAADRDVSNLRVLNLVA